MLINSPFKGWVRPLKETSDAAFAQGLLGDGIAIDPLSNELFAPCDAIISNIAPSLHSVILKTKTNLEILIHIGIDTVNLKGAGFKVHVKTGDIVKTGDKLITFDMDAIANKAPSLLTPIIVLSTEAKLNILCDYDFIDIGQPVFEIIDDQNIDAINQDFSKNSELEITLTQKIILDLANGIHARPAGKIAQVSKQFKSNIIMSLGARSARANSVVSMISLNAKCGDEIEIIAKGHDAKEALSSIVELLKTGLDKEEAHSTENSESSIIGQKNRNSNYLYGVSASNGYAIANAYIYEQSSEIFEQNGVGYEIEKEKLKNAINLVSNHIKENSSSFGDAAKNIALAHVEILHDPEINELAEQFLIDGLSAPAAWQKSSRKLEDVFKQSQSKKIQERASDLRDLEGQIIQALCGGISQTNIINKDVILIADDLLPSQFLALNHKNIKAICTKLGGPTSHVGILASSFGIPMLVAIGESLSKIENEQLIIVNADEGYLIPSPTKEEKINAQEKLNSRAQKSLIEAQNAKIDCQMLDGTRIEVFANLASIEEADKAIEKGAEGCGLLRTEFLFMERETAPSEEEQIKVLSSIANALQNKPLIVRTLDIGGDKPISYLPFEHEDNPALGMRGIRYQLKNIELLKTQIRAIIKAVPLEQCRIMLPMIIDIEEFRAARKIIDEVAKECKIKSKILVGIMVETPSAALMAENLAKEADFLSVGSNDLTQYALAIDRGNSELAAKADSMHPAVLNLIAIAANGAKKHNKWIGVCGGIASNPIAVPVLLGLGISELSVSISTLQQIKARVRELKMPDCVLLAQKALKASTATEVRNILLGAENEIA